MSVKKASFTHFYQIHPLVIFWLGLLTGALVVGLMFFYRVMNAADYESALLRSTKLKTYTSPTSTYTLDTYTAPTYSTSYPTGTTSIGEPPGGYVSIGEPVGG